MPDIDILVVDDDVATQGALRDMLGSEGWRVQTASLASQALQELAARTWTLVIASVNLTGFATPLFLTLRELSLAPALEAGKTRLRVLFLVPENADPQARSILESSGLPYSSKPFHLHDFLERVSDLLLENEAISEPIRQVRQARRKFAGLGGAVGRSSGAKLGQTQRRNTGMFADYSEYVMTEEEIAEYEKQEGEERERKKRKKTEGGPL